MKSERKVVLAAGTFDLLHYGHVYHLAEAKKAGGEQAKLVVVVARDSVVEKRKGTKPIVPEEQRRAVVEALKVVDEAILGPGLEEMDMQSIIESVRPDIVAVGYDRRDIEDDLRRLVAEKGLRIQIVRIGRFGGKDLSTSRIKRRILERYRS
ncbi:MAG: FAD synthase, partial [Desulfobacterales bacterium]|nr:FAD synthase [Desulfobacterales bacterium]